MISPWHKTLAIAVTAGYLAAVTFGHGFHCHRTGCRVDRACGNEAVAHVGCEGHDHRPGASSHGRGHCPDDAPRGAACSPLLAGPEALTDHGCPVCGFFSHHCVPVVAADVVTRGRLGDRIIGVASLTSARHEGGPQQPRAPPLGA